MIKTLINTTLLTLLTATPGVVGVSSAYYEETEGTNILNERLGVDDYGDATAVSLVTDYVPVDNPDKYDHLSYTANYTINGSKMNEFLATLQTWYVPLNSKKYLVDTNNNTSFFEVIMYDEDPVGDYYYYDKKVFTIIDLTMIEQGMPVQLKDWMTNNEQSDFVYNLRIRILLKTKQGGSLINLTSIIGNSEFYIFAITKAIQGNYQDGYNNGHDDGWQQGYNYGYDNGHADGYDLGKTDGYIAGLDAGGTGGTTNSVFELLERGWSGMADMLSIEVFSGFTIGGLLMIPLLFVVGLFIFKVLT